MKKPAVILTFVIAIVATGAIFTLKMSKGGGGNQELLFGLKSGQSFDQVSANIAGPFKSYFEAMEHSGVSDGSVTMGVMRPHFPDRALSELIAQDSDMKFATKKVLERDALFTLYFYKQKLHGVLVAFRDFQESEGDAHENLRKKITEQVVKKYQDKIEKHQGKFMEAFTYFKNKGILCGLASYEKEPDRGRNTTRLYLHCSDFTVFESVQKEFMKNKESNSGLEDI